MTTPHRPSPARRRIAAAGAAAVATGAVLPLTAPAGASPAPPVAVGLPALTVPKAPAAPRNDPGCSTHDGVIKRSADIHGALGIRKGVAILWYSPSTRCAWSSTLFLEGPGSVTYVGGALVRDGASTVPTTRISDTKAVSPAMDDRAPISASALGNIQVVYRGPDAFTPEYFSYSAQTGFY